MFQPEKKNCNNKFHDNNGIVLNIIFKNYDKMISGLWTYIWLVKGTRVGNIMKFMIIMK